MWLDNDGSQKAVRGLSPEAEDMVRAAAENAKIEADRAAWVACPVCSARMERSQVGGGIEVDFCAAHGSWFDRNELYSVSRGARGGLAPQAGLPSFQPTYSDPVVPTTSGLAIAGFICSFFCSLVGLGLCIAALNEIRSSGGAKTGEGLAIGDIAVAVISMLLGCCISLAGRS